MNEEKQYNELAECAKINFENFERAFPIAKQHPYYLIAKAQLDEALGYQSVEDSLAAIKPPTTVVEKGEKE